MAYNNLIVTERKKTAPESLVTTAGAWTRPTEAEQAAKLIMAPGRAFRKEPSHGMPRLPAPIPDEKDGKGREG
jgi:hypothetical protein